MKYLIGIDSGGTKSEIVAYDLEYNPIYKNIGGFGNPAVNLNETISNVSALIDSCLKELGRVECQLIGIGMAAVETGNYIEVIQNYIKNKFRVNTIVLNDAEMTCKAYLGNNDGILVVSGTGSSCYVQKNGEGEMVGGWSHILGDEGSGYHTVIEAFKEIVYKFDRQISFDSLSEALLGRIGGSTRSHIMNYIYTNQKNEIASLFKIIVDYSRKENPDAIKLLENAGKYLAESTLVSYKIKKFDKEIIIGLKGGVFYNSSYVLSSYKNEINNVINRYSLIEKDISATRGVINIYKNGILL
ncbi:N-acetylglucosamine kinase-like BadF-type ATPase [Sedimentibacter acidaminivorans]|uniref:N-acetylglucosamine kinase-like BadF-type ATPase n=1 Tax=Sedimentibacter acidaminivorans TaxID=913099 RepID=A0ABS4GD41_9FIRM|nr:BadF/BadG/BcrA/BcrD ATPase family protein [Sedimentibacter acidaminivorans]MBP1925604.1 N-acetylglucosamine kinase-like BadF-type ATPase [Sedimentibacter acidaminivorans]